MEYEIIVKDSNNPAWAIVKRKESVAAGKISVIVCCMETEKVFRQLIERYDPDEKTLGVFKNGFVDHKLLQISNYQRVKQLKTLQDIRPADYVDEIFGWANMLTGEVRQFFLDEFQFAFERENSRNERLWITRDKVLNDIKARRENEAMPKQVSGIPALRLSSRYGAKVDFLRVINALFELHFFNDEAGNPLTKENFMLRVGALFNTDLSGFSDNLNQAYNNTTLDANLKIFEQMIEITKKHVEDEPDNT